jgi:pimeloyl-ACP methyl ester carboxylesterase
MPNHNQLDIRIHGPVGATADVYLPGLHGDWTLIGSFREALGERVRFLEIAYPDTLTWSLEEHAVAIETALGNNGISRAWLLGESFGSQLAWIILARARLQVDGVILAGGFVQHPAQWAARLSAWCGERIPIGLMKLLLVGYAKLAAWRFRKHPETVDGIQRYVDTLTEDRRKALVYRLQLVSRSDLRATARRIHTPVFALTGLWDPIVPWVPVRTWLKKQCPALKEYKVLWQADHNVLGTGGTKAAELVLGWTGAEQLQYGGKLQDG